MRLILSSLLKLKGFYPKLKRVPHILLVPLLTILVLLSTIDANNSVIQEIVETNFITKLNQVHKPQRLQ